MAASRTAAHAAGAEAATCGVPPVCSKPSLAAPASAGGEISQATKLLIRQQTALAQLLLHTLHREDGVGVAPQGVQAAAPTHQKWPTPPGGAATVRAAANTTTAQVHAPNTPRRVGSAAGRARVAAARAAQALLPLPPPPAPSPPRTPTAVQLGPEVARLRAQAVRAATTQARMRADIAALRRQKAAAVRHAERAAAAREVAAAARVARVAEVAAAVHAVCEGRGAAERLAAKAAAVGEGLAAAAAAAEQRAADAEGRARRAERARAAAAQAAEALEVTVDELRGELEDQERWAGKCGTSCACGCAVVGWSSPSSHKGGCAARLHSFVARRVPLT
jgi:hypothetical protein